VSLSLVDAGDIVDVSETNSASIFTNQMSKVGTFLCIHINLTEFYPKDGGNSETSETSPKSPWGQKPLLLFIHNGTLWASSKVIDNQGIMSIVIIGK
jgi:hypothetical protein